MANNSAGVYDGLPFSYLTKTSPTEKQPPRSPKLSARSLSENERGEPVGEARPPDEEAEARPFTYLTPNSPTERDVPSRSPPTQQPQYFEPLEDERRSGNLYNNPSFNAQNNSRKLPRGEDTYPEQSVRVGSDPNYYTSIKDNDRQWDDRSRSAQRPQHTPRDYGSNNSNYELGGYASIPRPKVSGAVEGDSRDNFSQRPDYQNGNRGYDNMANVQKPRPLSRDSYLDSGLKRRDGCECRVVIMAIVLIILALGAGFAAGWFVSKSVNDSSDSNAGQGNPNTGASTSPMMDAITSTTTGTSTSTSATMVSSTLSTALTSTTATTTQTTEQSTTVPTSTEMTTLMQTMEQSTVTTNSDPESTASITTDAP